MESPTSQTIKIYRQHAKKYPWLMFFTLLGVVLASSLEILKPLLYKQFFDLLPLGAAQAPLLIWILVEILILSLSNWALWRIGTFGAAAFQAKVMRNLLSTCFNYLQRHSYSFFTNNFAGSLVRKVNKYSRSFEMITDQFYWAIIPTFIRLVAICSIVMFRSKVLGLGLIAWSVVYVLFNYWFSVYKLKYDTRRTEMDTLATGVLADAISNNTNIKMFSGYEFEKRRFKDTASKWYKATRTSWDLHNINEALQSLLMVGLEFFVFFYAVTLWRRGILSIGDFAMLQAYLLQLFSRLWDLGRNIRRIYEGFADAQEMTEILNMPHGIRDAANAQKLSVKHGEIVFKETSFGYGKSRAEIFNKLNFKIKAGEKVAFVGPSGGGKSTIVKLLFRFHDISSGKILIDGRDISACTQDSLRDNIALVPQEPILFHRSLMENILYGNRQADEREVLAVSRLAHCHEFISRLPKKYETFVGERGVKLSGGERQRVAIARAILKNAPILILDEATSSLDSENEMLIQDALKSLMKNRTTIVIAHRLSTIMQMDRIIVLKNGEIAEEGRHEELLKISKGAYQKLWEVQAGGFD